MRPSSLPILAQSPKFVSSDTSFAEDGTDRHHALRAHFCGDDTLIDLLDDEAAEGVRWAAEYIRLRAPMSDYPLEWELELPVIYPDLSEAKGHTDVACHLDLFDLKWRERNYAAQMAAYALGRLQQLGVNATIRCHLLFGATKRYEVLEFTTESADALLKTILDDINAAVECRPSDYCGWCANRVTCDVLNKRAQAVAAGREDWQLEQYHASKITEPAEMAKALAFVKPLDAWIKGIKFHAQRMVEKEGKKIPGWTLTPTKPKSYCSDIQAAFTATGMTVEDFLACCDLRLNTSKTNPNKKGLRNVYHKAKELPSLAAAKRELKSKLDPYVKTGSGGMTLKPEKGDDLTETSDDE